jgi:hypothetical protein
MLWTQPKVSKLFGTGAQRRAKQLKAYRSAESFSSRLAPVLLSKVNLEASFDAKQRQRLIEFFENADIRRQPRQPRKIARLAPGYFNNDLHPRDEYFLNDNWPEAP